MHLKIMLGYNSKSESEASDAALGPYGIISRKSLVCRKTLFAPPSILY